MRKREPQSFTERVYEVVRRIPSGKVASYGDVAALLGTPRAARGVGWALGALDGDTTVPWWRVINKRGAISLRHPEISPRIQRALLEDEGIRFDRAGCVDWASVRWIPAELAPDEPAERGKANPAKAKSAKTKSARPARGRR